MKHRVIVNVRSGLRTDVPYDAPEWLLEKLEGCEIPPKARPPKGVWRALVFWFRYSPVRQCWTVAKEAGLGDRWLFTAGLQQRNTWALDRNMYYGEWV